MKDFSKYKIDEDVFYSGAERKGQITINGNRYIIKYQKSSEIGLDLQPCLRISGKSYI